MSSAMQKMQANLFKIKMMINKKGGCNDIFATFCELEYQIRQVLKENSYNQKQMQQSKKSYESQIQGIQVHNSQKQKQLQQQNKAMRAEIFRLEQKLLNKSLTGIEDNIKQVQKKYEGSYKNDEVYKALKQQIEKLKKELNAKNQVIRKLKNSDGYTMTYKTSSTGVTDGKGNKLGGYNFGRRGDQDRDADFDGLQTGFKNGN